MSNEKAIRKGSVAEIGLSQKVLRKEAEGNPGVEVQVMRVIGKITAFETGIDKSPWIKFIGFFRLFNLVSGEVFRTSRVFLPLGADEVLAQFKANKEANEGDKDSNISHTELHIGFDYSVTENDFGVGYIFSAESIIPDDEKAVDPLENLMKTMKSLPAPASKAKGGKKLATA